MSNNKKPLPTLAADVSISDVLATIGLSSAQIALVIDTQKRLIGTITDGDVRRHLLKGAQLNASAKDVMNRSPLYLPTGSTDDEIRTLMRQYLIHQVPILNNDNQVVDLVTLDQLNGIASTPWDGSVLIMAGGEGRRLRPFTETVPKPLLEVGGKSMIEATLGQLSDHGFHNVFVSVRYKANLIKERLGDGRKFNANITYIHEDEPLGTAGALRLLPDGFDKQLLVINGDIVTHLDYRNIVRFHNEMDVMATMGVRDYEVQIPYGVVSMLDGMIESIIEKPLFSQFINAGIYVLEPNTIQFSREENIQDMPDLFEFLVSKSHRTAGFPIREYWRDVGRISDLEGANNDVLKRS